MGQEDVEKAIAVLLPESLANSSPVAEQVAKIAAKESIARHNEAVAKRAAAVAKSQEREAAQEAKKRAESAKNNAERAVEELKAQEAEEAYVVASATQQLLEGNTTEILASKMTQEDGAKFLAATNRSTSRRDVQKLLESLNINMNLQLTKNDTANLLACLLTANETQLKLLLNNKKVPIAIKIVIKRLLADSEIGDITSLERLWDRVFGKSAITDSLSPTLVARETIQRGILPDAPVSRESYEIIQREIYGVSPDNN